MRESTSEIEAKIAYWKQQLALVEAARWSPTRDKVAAVCRERLAIWERRAALSVVEGGGTLRRVRGAA